MMAMRLPVVATEVGGAAEVIAEGETGYLLDYGDVPALTDKLAAALVDDEPGRELRAAARRRVVANYSSAAMVAQFEALYDRLLGRGTGGGGRDSDRVDSPPRSESTE